jgi:hypothetical protein
LALLNEKYDLIRKDFQHVVLEGTAYEVGQQQGEILEKQNPGAAKWFASARIDPKKRGLMISKNCRLFTKNIALE